ncbi:uncharacterized protein LOC118274559 [Spodoptera frugiperda]|uniref:Uncharacterized protein LOC118274559 n=1 Tax=Spodoptera frugiperda TaxID=7108 RepID=A0A9R0DCP5_SPOFR|nr:uncharacterized protein LOC118274559 [Spodoptera frugiperda]
MLVLFLSFALLRISVSLSVSLPTEKNGRLKVQLQRSLSHVNEMLADIEGKIDKERRLLSQVDTDLNVKDANYMDYTVTDIWWHGSEIPDEPTLPSFTTAATTKPSVFVKTTKSTVGTHPPNWPFPKEEEGANSTQKESLLMHDLKSSMAVDGLGYGSAFTVKLLEIARKKDFLTTAELFNAFSAGMNKRIDEGKLASMGQDLLGAIKRSLVMLQSDSSGLYNEDAWAMMDMVHLVVKNKNIPIYEQLRQAINLYDSMFTKEEGEELFASLEVFERYPEGGKSATEVCERIIDAFLAPYIRMDGSREQKHFVRLIMQSAESANPGWRAQDFALRMGSNTTIPERRSMNYKKIVQHLLHKHPRILKKLNEHHKVKKLRKYRRDSRDYEDYDETRSKKHSSRRFRQRAFSESSNEADRDSTDSTLYHEHHINHVSSYRKKVMHQIRRRNRMKRRKHRRERRKHRRHRKRKQRERQLSMGNLSTTLTTATATTSTTATASSTSTTTAATTTTTTIAGNAAAKKLVSSYSPEYLKQLAISYFRKKQQAQNFRRFNVPSTEEEMYDNISVYSSNSTEHNNLLQKIREDSSYSDEEEHLRNNLYDALRHDNRTLVQFRAIHGEDTMNDTIRGISRESDNEWVLKNNIYKVFEKRNQVYRK